MSERASGAGVNGELRDFLRSRRARITPAQAGLPAVGPVKASRRVPGLRREEVAQLAGMSVDYYVRLERGRNVNVSEGVLDAVARALGLTDVEREHLFALAHPSRSTRFARSGSSGGSDGSGRNRTAAPQRVRPGLYLVLDQLTAVPAMIIGDRLDVLAMNPLAKALYQDFDALPHRERNMARYVFLDPAVRELYLEWEPAARSIVASLHLYAGRHPDDARLAELIGDLSLRDKDFRRWWADHDVLRRTNGDKHFRHPVVGDLTLAYEAMAPTGDPGQLLGIHVAEPGSPSEQGLQRLAEPAAGPGAEPRSASGSVPIPDRADSPNRS